MQYSHLYNAVSSPKPTLSLKQQKVNPDLLHVVIIFSTSILILVSVVAYFTTAYQGIAADFTCLNICTFHALKHNYGLSGAWRCMVCAYCIVCMRWTGQTIHFHEHKVQMFRSISEPMVCTNHTLPAMDNPYASKRNACTSEYATCGI